MNIQNIQQNKHITNKGICLIKSVLFVVMLIYMYGVLASLAHAATTWNATDWTLYDTVTIDAANIDETLTNFPVYVDLADMSAQFWSNVANGGGDIRVTNSSDVELPREVVAAETTGDTGELHFKADSISSSVDTEFRVWYNGTTTGDYAADATYGAENVWNDYAVVWHMNEFAQSDSAGNFQDSIVTGSWPDPSVVSGNIVMDGNDEVVATTSPGASIPITNWSTMIFWDESGNTVGGQFHDGSYDVMRIRNMNVTGDPNTFDVNSGNTPAVEITGAINDTGRQILLITYDDSAGLISIYNNGQLKATTTGEAPVSEWDGWEVYRIQGTLYESRGGTTTRSAAFARAQWINFSTTTDFYTAASYTPLVAGSPVTIIINSNASTTWEVPYNWNSASNTIEAIGAGGDGGISVASSKSGGGGGGGEYRKTVNVSLNPGSTVAINVPAGGDGSGADGALLKNNQGVVVLEAKNGGNASNNVQGAGGAGGIGAAAHYDGGSGGRGFVDPNRGPGGGGGGSAGPSGVGKDGGSGNTASYYGGGGGGGANGNLSTVGVTPTSEVGGAGGNGTAGTGGGTGGADDAVDSPGGDGSGGGGGGGGGKASGATDAPGGDGGVEHLWGIGIGPSGGGGGGGGANGSAATGDKDGGTGGAYGGGGGGCGMSGSKNAGECGGTGVGGQGLIVITYTPLDSAKVWNATDWTLYDTITIDADQVSEDLTDFPVYVDLADLSSRFWNTTDTTHTGVDIRVTTDDGSPIELPRELVSVSSTPETGELYFKAGSISSTTDTTFRIYYNGTTTSDYEPQHLYGAENVWTNNYIGVWHMDDDPEYVVYDATANGYDGTSTGGMSLSDVNTESMLGGGLTFDGSNQMLNLGDIDALDAFTDVSFSIWANRTTDNSASTNHDVDNVLFAKSSAVTNDNFEIGTDGTRYDLYVDSAGHAGPATFNADVTNGNWFHTYFTYAAGSDNETRIYKDGLGVTATSTWGGAADDSSTAVFTIGGARPDGDYWGEFIGTLDEARVSMTARSSGWVAAEYINQSDPASFYRVNSNNAQSWNATDWTTFDKITISASKVDDDLTDFPVYVDLADLSSRFWNTTDTTHTGVDIRVTTDDGSPIELPRELVFASSTTEMGELHFKANSISSTTDTTFRIYYNGTTTRDYEGSATYGAENVWTNGYVAVWHLGGDGDVRASYSWDSSSNRYNGDSISMVAASAVEGRVGSALDFDGAEDFISTELGWKTDMSEVTVSVWNNVATAELQSSTLFGAQDSGATERISAHAPWDNGIIYWDYGTRPGDGRVSASYSNYLNKWVYLNFVYDISPSTFQAIYVNDQVLVSGTTADEPSVDLSNFRIGGSYNSTYYHQGDIDEIRVSSVARDSAWIAAEYENQNNTQVFYSVSDTIVDREWNETDWILYDTITIDAINIDDDLADFPVYVDLADLSSQFWNTVSDGGGDIRVITDDLSTELSREVVAASTTLQIGELHFKANSLSSTTATTFRIYYNGSTTLEYPENHPYGKHSVWDSDYIGVWHLEEESNTTVGGYKDATAYSNDGTGISMDSPTDTIGTQDFDGINDRIDISDIVDDVDGVQGTMSTWMEVAVSELDGIYDGLVDIGDADSGADLLSLRVSVSDSFFFKYDENTNINVSEEVNADLYVGDWAYITGTWNTDYENNLYMNGTLSSGPNTRSGDTVVSNFDLASIGSDAESGAARYLTGKLDEVRISKIDRSAAWIAAEYENQKNTHAFYEAGVPNTEWNATDWMFYDTITINASNIDENLTDFPVYVDLSDLSSMFWSTVADGGGDIRVTTHEASPTELSREVVFASTTLQTGELHFKANSISATTDTTFRIYYNGDAGADYLVNHPYGAENVWSNNYAAVWHMNQDPSSELLLDSTVYQNSGTSEGSMTSDDLVVSHLGYGIDFDGGDDAFTLGKIIDGSSLMAAGSDLTMTAFVDHDRSGDLYQRIFDKSDGASALNGYTFMVNAGTTDGAMLMSVDAAAAAVPSAAIVPQDKWSHVAYVFEDTADEMTVYINASSSVASSFTKSIPAARTQARIGTWNHSTGREFNGVIDELRLATATRTAAWISAEHLNQSTTTNFYTVAPSGDAWNVTDWTNYDTITIRHEGIDEALTNFPVYVDLADLSANFWSTVADGGGDIRVTTDEASPAELPREVVSASTALETGELHFKTPRLSDVVDTSFRIYYNGVDYDYLTDQTYGAENVWDDYAVVWHMNELEQSDSAGNFPNASYSYDPTLDSNGDVVLDVIDSMEVTDTNAGIGNFSDWSAMLFWDESGNTSGGAFGEGDYNTMRIRYMDVTGNPNTVQIKSGNASSDTVSGVINETGRQILFITYDDSLGQISTYNNGHLIATSTGETPGPVWDHWEVFRIEGAHYESRGSLTTRPAAFVRAQWINFSTTTDFYTLTDTTNTTGSSTLANHDAGQISDAFGFLNKTNESLFAFKLTPESGNATTTRLELEVSGYSYEKLDTTDFTNIRLYRDNDNDTEYDAGDTQVGGAGIFSLWSKNNQYGTIVFSEDFAVTVAANYVVIADWTAPARGSQMTVNLKPIGIDMYESSGPVIVAGSVDSVQHQHENRGAGGGPAAIGGDAPVGDGYVLGGDEGGSGGDDAIDTNTDGDTIGNSPDFYWPTAQSGSWTNATNATDQTDGTYATAASVVTNEFTNYDDTVPGTDTIEGIAVKLEISGTTAAGDIGVELSWNGGLGWTAEKTTPTLTTNDTVVTLGGPSNTWGRSWSPSEITNENFALRVTGNPSSNTVQIDAIQVKIYHQASGGGGGGGGAI